MANDETIYQRIGKNSIRLLFIKPAHRDEQIECDLLTFDDINTAPDFEAVSYVWGQEQCQRPIICNGMRKTVTQNLEDALIQLRPLPIWDSVLTWPKDHRLHSSRNVWRHFARNRNEEQEDTASLQIAVWIDAICICQEDLEERADQVKLMGQIYRKARSVKIWLGNEEPQNFAVPDPSSNARWTFVQTKSLSDHFRDYGNMPVVLSFIAQALRNMQGQPNDLVSLRPVKDLQYRNLIYGLPAPSAEEWNILRSFLANSWFTRVWVVQEAVLARRAVVIMGDWHIDWDALGQAATWYADKGFALPRSMTNLLYSDNDLLPVCDAAMMWKFQRFPGSRLPLLSLLRDFRLRFATQDVDKLYAALGLAEENRFSQDNGFHMLLQPDYKREVKLVYRDVARFLIIEHGSLEVLSHVDKTPTQSPDWPSWVPDWRQVKGSVELWNAQETNTCQADGGEPLCMNIEEENNGLILQGVRADSIRAYGDKLSNYGLGHVTLSAEQDFLRAAWQLATRRPRTQEDTASRAAWDDLWEFVSTVTAHFQGEGGANDADEDMMQDAVKWFSMYVGGDIPRTSKKWAGWAKKRITDPGRFHEAFSHTCIDRRFFTTKDGRIGIGPEAMREGDEIVVLFGGKVPFLVRKIETRYNLIGECYVSGLMNGEAVVQWKQAGMESVMFEFC